MVGVGGETKMSEDKKDFENEVKKAIENATWLLLTGATYFVST
jgi:hypothetical protein